MKTNELSNIINKLKEIETKIDEIKLTFNNKLDAMNNYYSAVLTQQMVNKRKETANEPSIPKKKIKGKR